MAASHAMRTQSPTTKKGSKISWIALFLGAGLLVAFWVWPRYGAAPPQASRIAVSFISITNDTTGRRTAKFSITNGNEQKFLFNAFVHSTATNDVGSDYLPPHSDYVLSVPMPTSATRWRLAVSCAEADSSLLARVHGLWQRLVHRRIYYYAKPGEPFTVFSAEREP